MELTTSEGIAKMLLAAVETVVGLGGDWWSVYGFWLKLISGTVSLMLLAFIVYIIVKLFGLILPKDKWLDLVSLSAAQNRRVLRAWAKILERIERGNEAERKLAVIEADQILDEILKLSGYTGATMADRLKRLSATNLSNIEQVWEAHKVRNRLVHETEFELTQERARELVEVYRQAFLEFGLIRE